MLLFNHRGRVYWSTWAAVPGLGARDLCPVGEALVALFRVNIMM